MAFEAEEKTGLDSREVNAVLNPEMACQLGKYVTEVIDRPAVKGVFRGFRGSVTYFRLSAYGKNWEEAVRMVNRKRAKK